MSPPYCLSQYRDESPTIKAWKIIAALADYKAGNQPATIMHQIAKGYTDEQIRLVAGYFSAQKATR